MVIWTGRLGLLSSLLNNIGEVGVEAMAGFIGRFDKAWQGTLLGYVEPGSRSSLER